MPQFNVTKTTGKYQGGFNINSPMFGHQSFGVENTYKPLEEEISQRYGDVTNFNSPLYQQYRKYLSSAIPQMGTNALLAPLMAGNVDYGTAQKLGSQRAEEMGTQRNEMINRGVQGFGLEMQGQANPLLQMKSSNYFSLQNLGLEQQKLKMAEDQMRYDRKWSPLSSLLNMFSGFGALGFGSLFKGGNNYNPYGEMAQPGR